MFRILPGYQCPWGLALLLVALLPAVALAQGSKPVRAGTDSGRRLLAPPERESFSVVLFGDRTTGDASGLKVLRAAVRDTNLLDPDFVMTVGDMVQGYTGKKRWLQQMREYQAIVEKLNAPWYPAVGNHDVYGGKNHPPGNENLFKEHFGPLYYSFDYRFAHFIVLYTDEKLSFSNKARDQNLSDEQMRWLKEDLASTKADQIFVIQHHPRWLYAGTNWPMVHEMLRRDGRVVAVIAGHLHTWRDDGETDGIRYLVMAVTGGGTGPLTESAQVQVIAHLRVRRDGFSMAVIPAGSLRGIDMVLGGEVDEMLALRDADWVQAEGRVVMGSKPGSRSGFQVNLSNPSQRKMDFELSFPDADGWDFRPEATGGSLEPGASRRIPVLVTAPAFTSEQARVSCEASLIYVTKSGLRQPLRVVRTLSVSLPEAGDLANERPQANQVLKLDGKSAVKVPLRQEFKQLTLECWVKAPRIEKQWSGLVSKTQSSGFSLNWNRNSPSGQVRLPGHREYVSVAPDSFEEFDRWTHLAFAWDGEESRIFVNGKLQGKKPAKGPLQDNRLPLFIGSDTTSRGNPEGFFTGLVDEVRVSQVARYFKSFKPPRRLESDDDTVLLLHFDREFNGIFPDASGHENHGWPVGKPELLSVER